MNPAKKTASVITDLAKRIRRHLEVILEQLFADESDKDQKIRPEQGWNN